MKKIPINKCKVVELQEGDIIKVCIPIRIFSIDKDVKSLNGLNDGADLKAIKVTVSDGPFTGLNATVSANGDDKVERIFRAKPRTWWQRIKRMLGR